MTPKQERFVAEYLIDLNATQAAIRAGYSAKTAYSAGQRLLKHVDVSSAVDRAQAKRVSRTALAADAVLEAIRRPLAADVRKMFDERGNCRPIHELSAEEASLIAGYEVIVKNAKAGDGHVDEVLKVRLVDRSRYVEMAAKHFALLVDRQELTVNVNVVGRLAAGRKRLAERRGPQGVVVEGQKRVIDAEAKLLSDGATTK